MRDERGQTAAEFMGMLLIVAAIVLVLASPKVTGPIRDAFRGQTAAVATEDGDRGSRAKPKERGKARAEVKGEATPTPTPTGTRAQQLSRRLNELTEQLRTSKLPKRSAERERLESQRAQVAAAYAAERRRARRRASDGEPG